MCCKSFRHMTKKKVEQLVPKLTTFVSYVICHPPTLWIQVIALFNGAQISKICWHARKVGILHVTIIFNLCIIWKILLQIFLFYLKQLIEILKITSQKKYFFKYFIHSFTNLLSMSSNFSLTPSWTYHPYVKGLEMYLHLKTASQKLEPETFGFGDW